MSNNATISSKSFDKELLRNCYLLFILCFGEQGDEIILYLVCLQMNDKSNWVNNDFVTSSGLLSDKLFKKHHAEKQTYCNVVVCRELSIIISYTSMPLKYLGIIRPHLHLN